MADPVVDGSALSLIFDSDDANAGHSSLIVPHSSSPTPSAVIVYECDSCPPKAPRVLGLGGAVGGGRDDQDERVTGCWSSDKGKSASSFKVEVDFRDRDVLPKMMPRGRAGDEQDVW
jgi:hypothetical protein